MARIVFMGTPPFAVPSLERMAAEHDVVAVYSQPPQPSGGDEGRASAVHARAEELSLHVETPERLDDAAVADLRALAADFFIVVAYGLILPEDVLSLPKRVRSWARLTAAALAQCRRSIAPSPGDSMTGRNADGKLRMAGRCCGRPPIHTDDANAGRHVVWRFLPGMFLPKLS